MDKLTVEVSLESLIRVYKLATLGKLMAGLVHNLNGPLQNIGIDIEMMDHLLMNRDTRDKDVEDIFAPRLKRMEGEFDAINLLIRTTSMKASTEEDSGEHRNLNDLLDQEFSFLEANLYFKHNIQKDFDFQDDLPSITKFHEVVPQALSWFVQALVEELESEKIHKLRVMVRAKDSSVELSFVMEGGNLTESFLGGLEVETSPTQPIRIENRDVGVTLAMFLMKKVGAEIELEIAPPQTLIHLSIPLV